MNLQGQGQVAVKAQSSICEPDVLMILQGRRNTAAVTALRLKKTLSADVEFDVMMVNEWEGSVWLLPGNVTKLSQ